MRSENSVEFIVRGKLGEAPISPDNISLSLLNAFSKDIDSIISSITEVKKDEIIVSIEKSSFKIRVFTALTALNVLKSDFETLVSTNDLNSINDKRGKIIEDWLVKSKSQPGLEFEIIPFGSAGIKINEESKIQRIQSEIWVESELFLYGIITDLGGSNKPNIHLKTENGSNITIDCKKEDIENETENRVYKPSSIRVIAQQNINTGEIKESKFISFENYNPVFNDNELIASIEKGRNAWAEINNHVKWVRNLRSENE